MRRRGSGAGRGAGADDQILHAVHRLALADERLERRHRGPHLPLQQIDLARQLPAIRHRLDAHQQLVAEERLLHEVDRAELHRLDGGIDGPEPGHDDERGVDALLAQPLEDVEPRDAGHAHVGEDDVVDVALREHHPVLAAAGGLDRIAGAAEHARHAVADALVVVDHEDAGHGG